MSERLTITPLGPYIGAQVSGLDVTRPLSDNQFEQLYHAVLRHQVVFLREQAITPQQQRALALRFGDLHIHPVYPHAEGVEEIIVLDTHNDNPPDNDNWHTDVTFIETPPAGAILAAKLLPDTGGDTLWASGIAAYEALSVPFRTLLSGLRAEHDFKKIIPGIQVSQKRRGASALAGGGCETSSAAAPGGADPSGDGQAGAVRERRIHDAHCGCVRERERGAVRFPVRAYYQAGVSGALALAGE